MNPPCLCGRSAVLRTSWTDANPGRRFWGCPRYMEDRSNACNYHSWFDPIMCPRSRTLIPGLLRKIENLEFQVQRLEVVAEKKRKKERWLICIVCFLGFLLVSVLNMNNGSVASTFVMEPMLELS